MEGKKQPPRRDQERESGRGKSRDPMEEMQEGNKIIQRVLIDKERETETKRNQLLRRKTTKC